MLYLIKKRLYNITYYQKKSSDSEDNQPLSKKLKTTRTHLEPSDAEQQTVVKELVKEHKKTQAKPKRSEGTSGTHVYQAKKSYSKC